MNTIIALIFSAVIIGTLMPIQAALNAELTRVVKHPYLGALISFTTGTVALFVISLFQGIGPDEIKRISTASPHLFLGGALGALFVGSSIFFIPKLGATTMIVAFITGQLLMSLCMDHFGLFGIPSTPTSLSRVIGLFFLFLGLFLVVRKNS